MLDPTVKFVLWQIVTGEYPSEQGEYGCLRSGSSAQNGIRWRRVFHSFPAISAVFNDPNPVSCAGLAPTLSLAQRAVDLVSSTLP